MKNFLPSLAAAAVLMIPNPASAALPVGAKAPDFTTQAALAGKAFSFKLSQALKKGPVVLYFYPKAFTQGCTMEAHAFAEASEDFHKAGATVIGMSGDDIATLGKFSREACRDKFAVAAATPAIIASYAVAFQGKPAMSDRTSYVISKTGRIAYVHSELNYKDHVTNTLAAVKALGAGK